MFVFGDTRTPQKNQENPCNLFEILFHKCRNFGNPQFQHFSKTWAPENDEDPSKDFLETLGYVFHIYQKHEMGIW